jgi:NAD(P)-dependent dehydrogenase (short-subunit alcohol dehydrogenase family)
MGYNPKNLLSVESRRNGEMTMGFSDKAAIITGVAGGIGLATATMLGEQGATVIGWDFHEERLEQASKALKARNIEMTAVNADLENIDKIKALFAKTIEDFKRIDILVQCAGICYRSPVPEITPEEWDHIFALNLKSVFFAAQAALKVMCRQNYGKIINISSASGKSGGVAAGAHYAATKSAVICLTKSLALYSAPFGVNVNCVCPGPIKTPMTDVWGEAMNKSFAQKIPFKRYGTPEEVAEAICFLASDRARYITGETMDVNGGLVMD